MAAWPTGPHFALCFARLLGSSQKCARLWLPSHEAGTWGSSTQPSTLWEAVVMAPPSPQSPNWWLTSAQSKNLPWLRHYCRWGVCRPRWGRVSPCQMGMLWPGEGRRDLPGPPAASGRAGVHAGGQLTPASARPWLPCQGALAPSVKVASRYRWVDNHLGGKPRCFFLSIPCGQVLGPEGWWVVWTMVDVESKTCPAGRR